MSDWEYKWVENKVRDLGCSVMVGFVLLYCLPAMFMADVLMDGGYKLIEAIAVSLYWPIILGKMLAQFVLGGA